jgi:hypothetical protein
MSRRIRGIDTTCVLFRAVDLRGNIEVLEAHRRTSAWTRRPDAVRVFGGQPSRAPCNLARRTRRDARAPPFTGQSGPGATRIPSAHPRKRTLCPNQRLVDSN